MSQQYDGKFSILKGNYGMQGTPLSRGQLHTQHQSVTLGTSHSENIESVHSDWKRGEFHLKFNLIMIKRESEPKHKIKVGSFD